MFHPQGRLEEVLSKTLRFIHPYLFYITLNFHAEKAREGGFRIEDVYVNKFHKEPYFMHHIYAQYFHPETLLERVRDVRFYRMPRTLFKGFTVPDWARSKQKHGWEIDVYSRNVWEQALDDVKAETTPCPFPGDRLKPNPLNMLRGEFVGQGYSSRLFYNEVPQPTWWRSNGHILANPEDEKERFKTLYSFTHANQEYPLVFGIDTTTAEGRKAFKAEFDALREMAPDLVKPEHFIYPHELSPMITTEPHFRRVWQHYREHVFKQTVADAVSKGQITQDDHAAFERFVGLSQTPSFNLFILARQGKIDHFKGDEGFKAANRVWTALGFDTLEFDNKTSEPLEDQFWKFFDSTFHITEEGMRKALPEFCVDPSNRAKVEALLGHEHRKISH